MNRRFFIYITLICSSFLFLLTACTYPKPMLVKNAICVQTKGFKTHSITLLEPVIIIDSTAEIKSNSDNLTEAKKAITKYIQQRLISQGFTVTHESQLDKSEKKEIRQMKKILINKDILFKHQKRCKELGKYWDYLSRDDMLLFTGVRVAGTTMIGKRLLGGSDPLTATSKVRTNIFISIIDPKKSQIVWLKESFARSRAMGESFIHGTAWDDGSNRSAIHESLHLILSQLPTLKR